VVSVSKWNALLLGKESANDQRENHADTNGKEDESLDDNELIHMVDDAGMTESNQAISQSHNDGSYVDTVLRQTVGVVEVWQLLNHLRLQRHIWKTLH
jgi:hypothetical protein